MKTLLCVALLLTACGTQEDADEFMRMQGGAAGMAMAQGGAAGMAMPEGGAAGMTMQQGGAAGMAVVTGGKGGAGGVAVVPDCAEQGTPRTFQLHAAKCVTNGAFELKIFAFGPACYTYGVVLSLYTRPTHVSNALTKERDTEIFVNTCGPRMQDTDKCGFQISGPAQGVHACAIDKDGKVTSCTTFPACS